MKESWKTNGEKKKEERGKGKQPIVNSEVSFIVWWHWMLLWPAAVGLFLAVYTTDYAASCIFLQIVVYLSVFSVQCCFT